MGALPKKRQQSPGRVYFLFREDIRFIQNIARETRLLVKHGIGVQTRRELKLIPAKVVVLEHASQTHVIGSPSPL